MLAGTFASPQRQQRIPLLAAGWRMKHFPNQATL
jgi:hypothetical protein